MVAGFPFTAALIDGSHYPPRRYKLISVFIFVSLTLILRVSRATYHTFFETHLNLITPKSEKKEKKKKKITFLWYTIIKSDLRPPAVCESRHSLVVAELPRAGWL